MTIRLLQGYEDNFGKGFGEKFIFGLQIVTLIPIIYLLIYALRIEHRLLRIKFLVIYILLIPQCIIPIVRYGFLDLNSIFNSVCPMTQYIFLFLFFYFIFIVLVNDTVKLSKHNIGKREKIIFIIVLLIILIYLLTLCGIGYKDQLSETSTSFGISIVWILIHGGLLVVSIVIAIVGFSITRYISKSLARQNSRLSKDGKKDLLMLWIMIISLTFVSSIMIASDIYSFVVIKNDGYILSEIPAVNAILLGIFRMSTSNIWIWPSIYVFNSINVLKKQKLTQTNRYTEDSYIDYSVVLSKSSRSSGFSESEEHSQKQYRPVGLNDSQFKYKPSESEEYNSSFIDELTGKIIVSKMSIKSK